MRGFNPTSTETVAQDSTIGLVEEASSTRMEGGACLGGAAHEGGPVEGDEVVGQEAARALLRDLVLVHQHLPIQQRQVVRLQHAVLAHQRRREPHLRSTKHYICVNS